MGRLQVTNVLVGGPSGKNIYSRPYARALDHKYVSFKTNALNKSFDSFAIESFKNYHSSTIYLNARVADQQLQTYKI